MDDLLSHRSSSFSGAGLGLNGAFLTWGAGAALVLTLVLTGWLFIFNRSRTAALEEIAGQNRAKEENLRPELLNQIILLSDQLERARELLSRHVFTSNVFRLLETATHPQVRFANFAFAAEGLRAEMTGEAASYRALASQIGRLEREPQIERVEFGGLAATGEGLVGFKLTLFFKPELLRLR